MYNTRFSVSSGWSPSTHGGLNPLHDFLSNQILLRNVFLKLKKRQSYCPNVCSVVCFNVLMLKRDSL